MSGHKFRLGDRVIGVKPYDGDKKMLGVQGVVMNVDETSLYNNAIYLGIAFDTPVNGHDGAGLWYRGCGGRRGWNVSPDAVRYIGKRVNPDTADIG